MCSETNYRVFLYSAPSIPDLSKGGRKHWLSWGSVVHSSSSEEFLAQSSGDDAQTRELSGMENQEASNLEMQPRTSSYKGHQKHWI